MRGKDKKDTHLSHERLVDKAEGMFLYREGESHETPLDEFSRRRRIDDLLGQSMHYTSVLAQDEHRSGKGSRRRMWIGIAGAVALAASVLLLIVMGEPQRDPGQSPKPTAKAILTESTPQVFVVAGAATLGELELLRAGSSVNMSKTLVAGADRMVATIGESIVLVADKSARLRLFRNRPDDVAVFLEEGDVLVIVKPSKEQPAFAIDTKQGRISVVGTVFGVRQSMAGTAVEVFRGAVELDEGLKERRRLAASGWAMLGDLETATIDKQRMDRVVTVANVVTQLAFNRDDDILAKVDLNAVFSSSVTPEDDKTNAKTARAEIPTAQKSSPGQVAITKQQLLQLAQSAKRERNWQSAADILETLIQSFPNSVEARIALVSLGSLELGKLNRPAMALKRFDRYLAGKKSGNLAIEAYWARARALKKLGRTDKERIALSEFLTRFPNAFQSKEGAARLNALNQASSTQTSPH